MTDTPSNMFGMIARFEDPSELIKAAKKVRDAGFKKFDCHSPFPIHGMDDAMGLTRSPLGWVVGLFALVGVSGGILIQWWSASIAYPLVIAGKPLVSYQAYVPVAFALGVLLAAIGATISMLMFNRLPQLFHPVFYSDAFAKFSNDGFYVSIEHDDPKFDQHQTRTFLETIGGKDVEVLQG